MHPFYFKIEVMKCLTKANLHCQFDWVVNWTSQDVSLGVLLKRFNLLIRTVLNVDRMTSWTRIPDLMKRGRGGKEGIC